MVDWFDYETNKGPFRFKALSITMLVLEFVFPHIWAVIFEFLFYFIFYFPSFCYLCILYSQNLHMKDMLPDDIIKRPQEDLVL